MKAKRFLLTVLLVLLIAFILLNGLAYNHAYSMMNFTASGLRTIKPENLSLWGKVRTIIFGVNIPRPLSNGNPSDLARGCRILYVNGGEDTKLETWYCSQGEKTQLVILFHGYSAEKTSLSDEAKILLDLGVSTLLVDFRGSGGSSESYTTIGLRESEDVADIVNYVEKNLRHSSVVLFGQSMGAAAILRAMHELEVKPDGIILEAVFDRMLTTVQNRFSAMGLPSFPSAQLLVFWGGIQWGFDGFAHNPMDYASSVCSPALFLHGVDDPRATVVEGRRVFSAVPARHKEFKEFVAVGHEGYTSRFPNEWRTAVSDLLKRAENGKVNGIFSCNSQKID